MAERDNEPGESSQAYRQKVMTRLTDMFSDRQSYLIIISPTRALVHLG